MTQAIQNPPRKAPPAWLHGSIVLAVLLLGLFAIYYFIFKSDEPKPKVINPGADATASTATGGGTRTVRPRGTGMGTGAGRNQTPAIISILSGNNTGTSANSPITYTYDEAKGIGKIKARHENVVLTADYNGPARGRGGGGGMGGGGRNDSITNLSFEYTTDMMMSWVKVEDMNLHTLAWRATNTPSMATAAGITNDQRRELDALTYRPRLTNDEDAKLKNLLFAWVINPDAASSNEVLGAVKTYSQAHLADTKASFIKRIESIPKILTADQIANLKNR